MSASKRPWAVDGLSIADAYMAMVADLGSSDNDVQSDYANAALIVKAVNYHDRLKSALQVLLTKSEQHIFGDECLNERNEARALLSEIEASK